MEFKSQEAAGIYYQTGSDPELCNHSAEVRDLNFIIFSETHTLMHTDLQKPLILLNSLGSCLGTLSHA